MTDGADTGRGIVDRRKIAEFLYMRFPQEGDPTFLSDAEPRVINFHLRQADDLLNLITALTNDRAEKETE